MIKLVFLLLVSAISASAMTFGGSEFDLEQCRSQELEKLQDIIGLSQAGRWYTVEAICQQRKLETCRASEFSKISKVIGISQAGKMYHVENLCRHQSLDSCIAEAMAAAVGNPKDGLQNQILSALKLCDPK